MANPFFDNLISVQDSELLNDLSDEVFYNNGIEVQYMPRKVMRKDPILNEPLSSQFSDVYTLDAIIENTEQFFPGSAVFGAVGLSFGSFDKASIRFSRRRFIAITGMQEPTEGDLIYISANKILFEIVNANVGDPITSGGRIFDFEVWIKPYTHGEGNTDFSEVSKFNQSQELSSFLDNFIDRVDQEEWMSEFIDASTETASASDQRTSDMDVQHYNGIVRSDDEDLTADSESSANDQLESFKQGQIDRLKVMDQKIPDLAMNNAFECEGEKRVKKNDNPFFFE